MLELMLTRPDERRKLVDAAKGLQFLVLDELHTYRGRQGADVAMLVRRVRDACQSPALQCVGTSATMASAGTDADQRRVVAEVATRLFGAEVTADRVIGETLDRATTGDPDDIAQLSREVQAGGAAGDYEGLADSSLASWIETTFGLAIEQESGRLIRQRPARVRDSAARLADLTGRTVDQCAEAIRTTLLAGSAAGHPVTGRPLFAFRLHQFLSKGDTVYVSLEPEARRHITSQYQIAVPDRPDHVLLPLAFCRECGQEYLVVARSSEASDVIYRPRRDRDASGGDPVTGYLYVSTDQPWPADPLAGGPLARLLAGSTGKSPNAAAQVPAAPGPRRRRRHRGHRRRGHRRSVRPGSVPVLPALPGVLRTGPRQATSPSWRPWTPRAAVPRSPCSAPRSCARWTRSHPATSARRPASC